ncbi:hypothetical protein PIB30_103887, partial [Stylosanthes scabra]|nr:hypothetical protein [Stylosanthes scabra]
ERIRMAEGARLNRLEEMTLSNKHEVATLNRGLVEANERITEQKLQLDTIEKLLRDNFKPRTKIEEEIPIPDFNQDHSAHLFAENHRS